MDDMNENINNTENTQDYDNVEAFENQQTKHSLPLGWLIMFIGLILFGIYYYVAYTPAISGWTQTQAYEKSVNESKYLTK